MISGVFSCQTPPNQVWYATRVTPGTASSFGSMLIGSGEVNDTRACTNSRVAPTKSAPALKMVFTDCNRPNSRNAMITDNKVSIVRVRLRNRLAMTKPALVMKPPAAQPAKPPRFAGGNAADVRQNRFLRFCPLRRLLEQLPLLQVQRAARELRGLRIVSHH